MATHSDILSWRIPRTEEPGRLQSMGSQSRTQLNNYHFHFHMYMQRGKERGIKIYHFYMSFPLSPWHKGNLQLLIQGPHSDEKVSLTFSITVCSQQHPGLHLGGEKWGERWVSINAV